MSDTTKTGESRQELQDCIEELLKRLADERQLSSTQNICIAELQEQVKQLQAFNKFLSDYHHDCKLAATFNDNNPEAEEVLRAVEYIKSEWDRLAEGERNDLPTL